MFMLQTYNSSDDSENETEAIKKPSTSEEVKVNCEEKATKSDSNTLESEKFSFASSSIATITSKLCAAPEVLPPEGTSICSRHVDSSTTELTYNPSYTELFASTVGPENPFKSRQQCAPRNMLSGYTEKTHISDFQFENQRRTFASFGYAMDPTVDGIANEGNVLIGATQTAEENRGKTVFEQTSKKRMKRKKNRNDDPSDVEGFKGPWAPYVDQKQVAKPNEEEAAELAEILAKRSKNTKNVDDKPINEKTVLHIDDPVDYQGRPFLHPPKDVGINLNSDSPPDKCFIPKSHIHTWEGHTKGISQIKFFPKSAHLLLSCSMDSRIKIWEVYKKRRCVRTYSGHHQAVRDVSFDNNGKRFLSAGYDRFIKLWDTETGECISRFTNNGIGNCIKFNPDPDKQQLFIAGTGSKKIVCWDIRSGEITQEYNRHLGIVNTITFVDENRRFVTSSDDKTLRVWEWDIPIDIKCISDPVMHTMPAIALSPNQKWLACQSLDNKIVIISAINKFQIQTKKKFTGHMVAGYACGLDFSPDMSYLASGDGDGKCYVWDWGTTRLCKNWKAHDDVCIATMWHPHESSRLVTAGWDGKIKYWD